METYLFKFSACLAIFWLVYILFLERQTMHRFKRFYLLGAIIAALVIPALTITHYIEPIVTGFEVSPLFIPIENTISEIIPQVQAPFWDLETVLWTIYGLGVLLFSIRFVINLYKMYRRISENERITKRSFIYILLNECHIPHSFFKYLFFDRSKFENSSIPEEVKLHEETHAKQLHSLDIIVIELLQIVFWFHPLIYILKHHVKLNHEFLADQAVLKQGSDTKTYQNILLQFSSPDSYRDTQEYQLSSAINYSSIKKRFTVMKTQTSKTRIWLSGLLLLPIVAILFYSFSTKEYVEKETIETSATLQIENVVQIEGATERGIKEFQEKATIKQVEEYNTLAKKYNEQPKAQRVIPANDLRQLESIYRLMSNNQKEESLPFPECNLISEQEPPIMLILINRKDQLLVDDEPGTIETIDNKLKKLAKDGKSGRLVVIKYDEETSKAVISRIEALVNANKFKVASFNISEIPPPPPPPAKQEKATAKQVADFNAWAKKLNTAMAKAEATNDYANLIVKQKDVEKYKGIYFKLMSAEQKRNAEPYPKFPPPPPPPAAPKVKKGENSNIPPPPPPPTKAPQYKNGKKKTLNEIIKETPKSVKSGYEMLDNEESHYYTVYKGEKTYYNKDGYITDKKGKILPPPPPVTVSTLDFVIRMAKANAKFFNEGKSITSDIAIELIKRNPKLNVLAKKTDTKEPLVYISKKPTKIGIKE